MDAKYIKLFKITSKVILNHPLHSLLFFFGIILVGLTQIVSLGSLYPTILTLINKNSQGNTLISYFDKALLLAGMTPGLLNYLVLFVTINAVSALIYVMLDVYQGYFLRQLEFNERYSLVRKVVYSKWSTLAGLNHGDFINAVTHEAEGYKVVIKYCFIIVSSLAQIVFYAYFAFVVDQRVVMLSIVLFITSAIVLYPLLEKASTLGQEWTDAYSKLTDGLVGATRAFKNIKADSMEHFVTKYIKYPIYNVSNVYFKNFALSAIQTKLSDFSGFVILGAIIYYGAVTLGIETANLVLILVVYSRLIPQIKTAIDAFHRAYSTLPSIDKLQEISKKCTIETNTKGISLNEDLKIITMKSVGFRYGDCSTLFDGLTLEMKKGEFWAISGPTGTGKTTFLDIIARLIEPTSGTIYYNNIPCEEINVDSLHKRIGYLTQDHFIFAGTLLENILWGSDNSGKSEIDRVIKIAQLEDMLSEKKMDFYVSESGHNLSGGQKQRVAIARIFLKDFDFVLLDEPTSALDSSTGDGFIYALSQLKGEIGIVMITHREEFLKYADYILKIENGVASKYDVPIISKTIQTVDKKTQMNLSKA